MDLEELLASVSGVKKEQRSSTVRPGLGLKLRLLPELHTPPPPPLPSASSTPAQLSTPESSISHTKLYCVCRQPYDDTRAMIGCDECDNWYHLACVGLDEQTVQRIDSYICAACSAETGKTTRYCASSKDDLAPGLRTDMRGHAAFDASAQMQPRAEKQFAPVARRHLVAEEDEMHAAQPADDHVIPDAEDGVVLSRMSSYSSVMQRKLQKPRAGRGAEEDIFDKHAASNASFENATAEHISKALGRSGTSVIPQHTIRTYNKGHYVNADLRYLNFASLGKFDVVLIDPPWRIAGGQSRQESSNMFSNNSWRLTYQTLSNEEIINLDVETLSDAGFCFLWTINSSLQFALQCLNKWGYNYVDKIVWIKKKSPDSISVTTGYYLLHSTELLLIGAKYPKKSDTLSGKLQYISKVSNDVLFSEVGRASEKPQEVYSIIEAMLPGSRRVELFARNHNIRPGWLSIGNRLGPTFDMAVSKVAPKFSCGDCGADIGASQRRFKSKHLPRTCWCEACVGERRDECFVLDNLIDEPVYHDWYTCDDCGAYPIRGVRFSCTACDALDLCETCFDALHASLQGRQHDVAAAANITVAAAAPMVSRDCDNSQEVPCPGKKSCAVPAHSCSPAETFAAVEVPDPGQGFPVHYSIRCSSCLVCPIVGERFRCSDCPKKHGEINLCRNCFFAQKQPKQHLHTHEMELIPEPARKIQALKCTHCKSKTSPFYLCKTCSNLALCSECLARQDELMPFERCGTHRTFHMFTKVTG